MNGHYRLVSLALLVTVSLMNPFTADAREVQSLDGKWQIAFDHHNVGKKEQWHLQRNFEKLSGRKTIDVPSCWELTEKDYEGVAFYSRTFSIPASWKDKTVRLHFDAVNFISEVFLNDKPLGTHEGGFTPFKFRIDEVMRAGEENTLTMRVVGPILLTHKTIDGIGKMQTPQWRGAISGGIWQPVRMIATGNVLVKDVFIEPEISGNTVTFHVELERVGKESGPAVAEVSVRSPGPPGRIVAKTGETLDLDQDTTRQSWTVKIPEATYWSPDDPHLYEAEVKVLVDGKPSDTWRHRFGMREFTVRGNKFYLNNEPLYLKATFFEGLYPTRLSYPDSREMAIREIKLAKEAGFNMIRPWRKPAPPMWLDLADEIGVLVVGSMVIECMDLPRDSDRLQGWVENEVRESIMRDRNRACIVQWELFNELKRPILKEMLEPMSVLARKLDPTRMILDESGGWAQGANLYLPYESEPTKFNDIHDYPGPQINENVYNKLILTGAKTHKQMRAMGLHGRLPGRNVVPGIMTFFSELGYGSLPDLPGNNRQFRKTGNPIAPPYIYHQRLADEHAAVLKESGFDSVYPDLTQFCLDQQKIQGTANKRMIEAVRCNPLVSGYCIHALTAGDWIIGAGLLDLFRNPKTYAYEGTKAANQPRIIAVRVRPRNVYAEQGTTIDLTGVNELDMMKGTLKVEVASANGKVVFSRESKAALKRGITPLLSERLDTKALEGTYTVSARIVSDKGFPVAENKYDFDVFPAERLVAPRPRIALFEQRNSLKPFLKESGIECVDFKAGADLSLPVFVSHTEARTGEQKALFKELGKFVNDGGTVVYLQGGGSRMPWAKAGKASPLLPVRAGIKASIGLWLCISHIVNDHPIFDGLPVNCMMGPVYENVWAPGTLMGIEGKPIAGSIGFDFAPDFDVSKRHYYGPGETWWGTDVADIPVGKGRCILSQLRLVENLGKDPVADLIFFNLIKFAGK